MQVFVKTVAGKTIKLVVESSVDTIESATVKIEDMTIKLDVQKEPTYQFEIIILNTIDYQKFTLIVASSDTIHSVKAKIEEKVEGYPLHEQRLLYDNTRLDDSLTLNDYHIYSKSTLDLCRRI
ncbi:polyubiquitin-like [Impatiens glandulifera]|uniref:polyubiquitin-like n=1 Tax=Impatiens glandulifera TaxID=253017 RepID=UPI001FB0E03D|nr:polyubiquitin-like [Impatiens glandulifera]